ncbi:phage portal protein [Parafrankia sp. EUN1f]|uniref:phage portal protein n=1 Tax=Parafrankia sp. EUN1f TaxID=102897 RepID=UPI0001C452EC|nr:phage portal protein [Parafrankia sp. EUN1f]EFC79017.1 hypothetical protein FrEUN1fDRAFT_7868 [Parafrankia sp. EUN1f]
MPLPKGGSNPWPPKEHQAAFDRFNVWSAWWTGDPDALARAYIDLEAQGSASERNFAPRRTQYAGGVIGAVSRFFWGQPPSVGSLRNKLHVPIGSDIATTSADLLFSEPPAITLPTAGAQDRFDTIRDDAGLDAALVEAAEVAAAFGGVFLRIRWDKELREHPWIDAVHPDSAVPEFAGPALKAVTFWQSFTPDGGGVVIRHLERHEPGKILHGTYRGTRDSLGRPVPLAEVKSLEGIAGEVNEDGAIPTGLPDGLLSAVYVPNMRPARLWRDRPALAYLGRSDYSGVEPLMDALDEVYSSWMRDIRLAKGRLVVPQAYMQTQGRGQGAVFDVDQEIFTQLNMPPQTQGGAQITISQFAIRVDEHQRSAQQLVDQIVRAAGYSAQTFGSDADGAAAAATATEVNAKDRRSAITRDKKIRYWTPELRRLVRALLVIDATVFNTKGVGDPEEPPAIDWEDEVSEAPLTVAQTAQALFAAQSASIETRVRMVNPEWDDQAVQEEVDRIKEETGGGMGMGMGDPFGMGDEGPTGQPSEEEPPPDEDSAGPPAPPGGGKPAPAAFLAKKRPPAPPAR